MRYCENCGMIYEDSTTAYCSMCGGRLIDDSVNQNNNVNNAQNNVPSGNQNNGAYGGQNNGAYNGQNNGAYNGQNNGAYGGQNNGAYRPQNNGAYGGQNNVPNGAYGTQQQPTYNTPNIPNTRVGVTKMGIAGMVLGIIMLIVSICLSAAISGHNDGGARFAAIFLYSIPGLVFSIIGLVACVRCRRVGKMFAIAGIVLVAIALIISLV